MRVAGPDAAEAEKEEAVVEQTMKKTVSKLQSAAVVARAAVRRMAGNLGVQDGRKEGAGTSVEGQGKQVAVNSLLLGGMVSSGSIDVDLLQRQMLKGMGR